MEKREATALGVWLLLLALGAILFDKGIISLFWALTPLWLPVILAGILGYIIVITLLLAWEKHKKFRPCCENCLFGSARKLTDGCIGEKFGEEYGTVCPYYEKNPSQTQEDGKENS